MWVIRTPPSTRGVNDGPPGFSASSGEGMTDIFLSYTERDRDTARRIAEALGSAGWSVWWDRRIPAGETWRSVLEHALENMRCMVVLWSTKSIESEWVYEEASEGRRQGKLVPVMIENVRPPAGFREIQAADLTGWDGSADFDGLRMLLSDLENLLGKTGGDSAKGNSPGQANRCRRVPRRSIRSHRNTRLHATQEGRGKAAAAAVGTGCRAACSRHGSLLWFFFAAAGDALSSAPDGCQSAQRIPLRHRRQRLPSPQPPPRPQAALHPEVARDLRAVPETSTSPPSRSRVTPETSSTTRSSDSTRLSSARCANLLERIQLGETLSEASQARFDKECRQ